MCTLLVDLISNSLFTLFCNCYICFQYINSHIKFHLHFALPKIHLVQSCKPFTLVLFRANAQVVLYMFCTCLEQIFFLSQGKNSDKLVLIEIQNTPNCCYQKQEWTGQSTCSFLLCFTFGSFWDQICALLFVGITMENLFWFWT